MARRGIYPGTFDPFHNGHLDLIQRSLRLVDELVVAVARNVEKTPLFAVEERLDMIRAATAGLSGVNVTSFEGLLVHFAARERISVVIRGLRAVSDFEYEFQMALMNRKLKEELETVFLMPNEAYSYLSSHLIKEVASMGGSVRGLVPPDVEKRLAEKFLRR
jgi:pantetheine-phosphate adenylyltransferase